MRVVANFAMVRGDEGALYTLGDVFDVSDERGKELMELGAVSQVADDKDEGVAKPEPKAEQPAKADDTEGRRSPGRPRKS
jgi:hypothetical protein